LANLPQIFAQPSLPSVQAVRVPRGAFGETFGAELEQAAGKLFEAQQLLETQTALDKRDELYQQRKMDMMQNPQKYAEMSYPEFLKQFHDNAKADDQAVMQDSSFFIRHHLSPLFARVQRHEFDMQSTEYHRLWMDNARSQVITSVDDLTRQIGSADNEQQRQFHTERLNATLNAAGRVGIFPQVEVANMRIQANRKIVDFDLSRDARADPFGFSEQVERGDYAGRADQRQIQFALDIAEKLQNRRDQREQRLNRARGEAAERVFWQDAENHQLDEERLDHAAAYYNWPKDKIDRIKRVNIGLRESAPEAEKLIIDALDPVNKVEPTLGDVAEANRRLRALGDRVSTDSAEYRQGMNHLRSLQNQLTPGTPESRDRTYRSDARRRLGQLMMQYDLRDEPELRGKLMGEIETMPGVGTQLQNNLNQYLGNKEKEWKARGEKNAEQLKSIQGLKSLAK